MQRLEHLGLRGRPELADDQAVGEEEDPVGDRRRARVESPLKSMIDPAAASTSRSARIFASSAGDTVALPLDE